MNRLPDFETLRRQVSQEAVDRLGLLRPEARGTVNRLLEEAYEVHPKTICAAYRKTGEQLSKPEKRALGIRANAFMTREALAEVSEAGMGDSIHAHELTVLRACFGLFRYRNALAAEQMLREHPGTSVEVQYDVFHSDACKVCSALHHKPVGPDWGLLAPTDCTCVIAPFGLHLHVDWIGSLLDQERSVEGVSRLSLLTKFKRLFRRSQDPE